MPNDQTPAQPAGTRQISGDEKAQAFMEKTEGVLKKGVNGTGDGVRAVWRDPLMSVRLLDRLIDWARSFFPAELYDLIARFVTRAGHIGLVAAAPFGLVFFTILGIKRERFSLFVYGLGFILVLIIAQYVAHKFIAALNAMVLSAASTLKSDAFLRSVALICEVAGIVAFVWLTVIAIREKEWIPFWLGLVTAIMCDFLAFMAIHPSLVSTRVDENASAGEEAIGIVSFFVKSVMRLIPVVFGFLAALGSLFLVVASINLLRDKRMYEYYGMADASLIVYAALLPFAAYVVFSLYCLLIDILRAILSIRDIPRR